VTAKRSADLTALHCRYLVQDVHLPSTPAAVGTALRSGNLECLKLLLESKPNGGTRGLKSDGQPICWSRLDVLLAAEHGFAECVDFAVAHGCPYDANVRIEIPQTYLLHIGFASQAPVV
jgi:hypothetical protein